MTKDATKADRRFTLREFVIYVSLFAIALAIVRVLSQLDEQPAGPLVTALLALLGLGVLILLGALTAVGVAVPLGGRHRAVPAAVVGGIVLPLLLFIIFSILVYHAHSRPRVIRSGVGLKARLDAAERNREAEGRDTR